MNIALVSVGLLVVVLAVGDSRRNPPLNELMQTALFASLGAVLAIVGLLV